MLVKTRNGDGSDDVMFSVKFGICLFLWTEFETDKTYQKWPMK